jgi:hypothetical protein
MPQRRRGKPRKTVAGRLVALAIGLALLVVVAELGLRIAMPTWTEFYSGRFQAFEWVPGFGRAVVGKPGFDGWFSQNNGDFRAHVRLNAKGFRETEPPAAADGRLWLLGDSMTWGWGVAADRSYGAVAARAAGVKSYNLASPGANVCDYQATLARIPSEVRPRAVVLGLVMENDISPYNCPRGNAPATPPPDWADLGPTGLSLHTAKLWLTDHSALYNVVAVSLKRIGSVERALVMIGLVAEPHVQHFSPASSEAYRDAVARTAAEIAWLKTRLPANVPFAVLIVPSRFDVRDRAAPEIERRQAVIAALTEKEIAVIDLAEPFRDAGFGPTHFVHDGHWREQGHEVAGKAVAAWLAGTLNARAEP